MTGRACCGGRCCGVWSSGESPPVGSSVPFSPLPAGSGAFKQACKRQHIYARTV